jgi:hypothetical protein
MTNSVETFQMPEGTVQFDHSTGVMSAVWNNGYTETWPPRGHSIDTLRDAFYFFTGQYERMGA